MPARRQRDHVDLGADEGYARASPAGVASRRRSCPPLASPPPPVRRSTPSRRRGSSGSARAAREREAAIAALHALLLKAARFEVAPPPRGVPQLRGDDHDDLAQQSADDALVAVLRKLDDFRGDSRFTTWAYKFALLEAAVKVRRRAWQGREVPLEPESWALLADRRLDAARGRRDGRAVRRAARGDRGRPEPAPARGARRRDAQRRPDRRAGRAAGHHPRRALQDHPRRPPQASGRARRARPRVDGRTETPSVMTADPIDDRLLARLARARGPELTCEQCFDAARPLRRARARRRATPTRQVPGMRAHLAGLPGLRRGPREPAGLRDTAAHRRRLKGRQPAAHRSLAHEARGCTVLGVIWVCNMQFGTLAP